MGLRVFVTLLFLALLAVAGAAVGPQAGGALLALTNATVVVGNGQTLPKATVLVRDGTIAAVGAKTAVPAGSTVVDLKGSYLYPGLIDALTVQGLRRATAPKPPAGGSQAQAATSQAPPPPDHAGPDGGGFFAHVQAADQLEGDAAVYAPWLDAGVLALHVSPDRGIFEGQTAVVSFDGETGAPKVVRRAVGMRIALRTLSAPRRAGSPVPGGLYPGALLSVWSHVKQTVLDARHYAATAALPAAERAAVRYDEPTRALEALRPVADGSMPLIIPANAEREVQRVIDLADQFSVRCVVAGGYEAARHAETLKTKRLPVVVSLNFPQPKVIALGQQAEFVQTAAAAAPEETYQEIRFRQHAPEAPAELARAGVRFAVASDGLKTGREFLAGLRLAVRKGLPRDQAIRAATLSAAEILGVDQQLGSIEAGKVANLIVADGDLFDEQARISAVYVAGRVRTIAETAGGAAKTAGGANPSPAPPVPEPARSAAAARPGQAGAAPARPAAPPPASSDIFFPPPVVAKEFLIRNATVMTATHGTLKNTSILVRDGKIAAIGQNLKASPQATVVDATGKWVTPGLIDTHNHFASDAHNDATIAVTSMTNIQDVLNPTDIEIYRALAAGVTIVNTMHGSVNPIGGQNVLIKTRWGKDAKDLVVTGATPTLKIALGTNPKSRGTNPAPGVTRRYPASRMGLEDVIRQAFTEARDYKAQWDSYEKAKAAGQAPPVAPRRNLALEPIAEMLAGKRSALVHAYRADEMLMIMRMAEEFGFRIGRFEHGAEAYKIAPEMARHGAGVAAFDLLGTKVESWDAIPEAIAILTKAGVSVSIGTDGGAVAHMMHLAASALDEGLTEDQAIALVTINAAKQHGIDRFAGSIDEGKDADLVIFDKYPLSVYARPEQVYIDGQLYFSRERDRARQTALEADKKRLLALDEGPAPRTTDAVPGRDNAPRPDIASVPARPANTPYAEWATDDAAEIGERSPGGPFPAASDRPRTAENSPTGGAPAAASYVIQHAKIVTVSGPTLDDASVVVTGGRIADVGSTVSVPAGATAIDAKGMTLYPGLFDAATGIGLSEVPGIVESDDFSDLGEFTPQLMAFHAFHIDSVFVAIARSAGILNIVSAPSGGMLGGQAAVMALAGWTADEMELARHGPMMLDFPKLLSYEAPAYTRRRHPYAETKDYDTKMRELTEFFASARRYMEAKERRPGGPGEVPARDARYETMVPILKGQQPVFIEVQSDRDIRKAVEFAKAQKLNYALLGADDAPKVADFLKENGVRVVLGLPGPQPIREDDSIDGVCRAAATLHERGVTFAIGTGHGASDNRSLRHDVGMAVACGLPADVALRSVTLTPAEIAGVADKVGSIEKGKKANLVLTDGDIFEYGTHITRLFINGAPVAIGSRYTELYERYKDRR